MMRSFDPLCVSSPFQQATAQPLTTDVSAAAQLSASPLHCQDLKDVERPDWSDHGSKRSRTSQRACGQLFRSQRKFPSCEEVPKTEGSEVGQFSRFGWMFGFDGMDEGASIGLGGSMARNLRSSAGSSISSCRVLGSAARSRTHKVYTASC